jgi:50S ribosomal protein L16 3-hydroxylase
MPVPRFMRVAWQRRPLLIRNALPDFSSPLEPARLFELARRDDVESRLVTRRGDRWHVQHGPLPRLPSTRRRCWTLLVQGVDLVDSAAHSLLSRFRFVPDARLDDLMVSYATDGGGVGPHVDSYDVFLLQAAGRRHWRIGRQRHLQLQPGQPLRVLSDFKPEHEWTLEPGDLLYLPPGVAHEGTAIGECMTCSIGFRAPTYQELVEPWLADLGEHAHFGGRYSDAGLTATRRPGQLPAPMARRIHERLLRVRPTPETTLRFLLRYLSEPKAHVVFEQPGSSAGFGAAVRSRGIVLDRRTRMLYARGQLAINGESLRPPRAAWPALTSLADRRAATPEQLQSLPSSGWELLRDWYRAGWLHLARARNK